MFHFFCPTLYIQASTCKRKISLLTQNDRKSLLPFSDILHGAAQRPPLVLHETVVSYTRWPQSSFPGFFRVINVLFHRLAQQKVNFNNDLHQRSFHINSSNIIFFGQRRYSLSQSAAVLHKYLNDELKKLCLLLLFPEVAQNSLRIP